MPDINISELIQQSSGTYGKAPMQVMLCTVESVSKSERTATVVPVTDNLSAFPAQLMSDIADGVLILPTKGSTVRVLLSELSTPAIIQYSSVDELYVVTKGEYLKVYGSGLELDGTSFGGVMKVVPSVAAWNAIQKDINLLKSSLSAILAATTALNTTLLGAPAAPVLGATLSPFTTAIISAWTTYATQVLALTTRSQIENTKVKHGNGE